MKCRNNVRPLSTICGWKILEHCKAIFIAFGFIDNGVCLKFTSTIIIFRMFLGGIYHITARSYIRLNSKGGLEE